jgi:nicotinamide riboside kinase
LFLIFLTVYYLKVGSQEFLKNPSAFSLDSSVQPLVHPKILITGGPKTGKTTLAQGLAKDLGLVYLTVPTIINSILEGQDVTSLYDDIEKALCFGKALSSKTLTEAIKTVTHRITSSNKG